MTSEEQSETDPIEAVRQGTPVALVITVQTSAGTQTYTCYVYQSSVLIETGSDDGAVTTMATDDLGAYVADLIDPLHAGCEHRELEQFATLDDFAAAVDRYPVLNETVALTTLALLDRQAEAAQVCVIYASPDSVAVLEGGPTAENPTLAYALTEVSAEDLLDAVNRLLAGVTLPDPMPVVS